MQNAISSEPGEGRIINFRDYDKKFSPHVVCIYLLILITTLLLRADFSPRNLKYV